MSAPSLRERCRLAAHLLVLVTPAIAAMGAAGGARDNGISIKAIAEVVVKVSRGGHETAHLESADRVVPGDEVIYTLEIRSTAAKVQPPPTVDYPIPEHMRYVADSAVGAGAVVSYSIDGGHSFAQPEELFVTDQDGKKRPAAAEEYTHIRWQLKHSLKGHAVAFARFRAIVK